MNRIKLLTLVHASPNVERLGNLSCMRLWTVRLPSSGGQSRSSTDLGMTTTSERRVSDVCGVVDGDDVVGSVSWNILAGKVCCIRVSHLG